jgi:hypothetical protein
MMEYGGKKTVHNIREGGQRLGLRAFQLEQCKMNKKNLTLKKWLHIYNGSPIKGFSFCVAVYLNTKLKRILRK